MNLSERLVRIASFVPPGLVVADVGTDHALLPIFLVSNNISPRVIASDLAQGPLGFARSNVEHYGLGDKIMLKLGNGLEPFSPGEVQVVIIAGMGSIKILEILNGSPAVLKNIQRLILQPQRGADMVRRWLLEHRWQIIDEDLLLEQGNYYELIVSEPLGDAEPNFKKAEPSQRELEMLEIGPRLLAKKAPLLLPFLQEKVRFAESVLVSLCQAKEPAAIKARKEWQRKILLYRRVIERVSQMSTDL